MVAAIDMVGKSFGRLKVIKRDGSTLLGQAKWLCECQCGNTTIVSGAHLRGKRILSCGCLRKENTSKAVRKYNAYFYEGDYTMSAIASNINIKFYFDQEDYELLKDYCWRIDKKGYVVTNDPTTGKAIWLHRLIMGFPKCDVDHKDRNPLNNKRLNLREATHQQNSINKGLQSNNKSGIAGVLRTVSRKWNSRLTVNKKVVFNKIYENFDDAVIARLQAELEYFGPDFAPQRHLFEKYEII